MHRKRMDMKDFLKTSATLIKGCLVFALPEEMTDEMIDMIREFIISKASEKDIKGAVLNFSTVRVIDSFIYEAFRQISMALSLIGVEAVWAGLSPGVITAMADLNIDLDKLKVKTVYSVENALEYLLEIHR